MERQFLNIVFAPTVHFDTKTEGLCGFMDNDDTNDFIGPDGMSYSDAIDFSESCKNTYLHA